MKENAIDEFIDWFEGLLLDILEPFRREESGFYKLYEIGDFLEESLKNVNDIKTVKETTSLLLFKVEKKLSNLLLGEREFAYYPSLSIYKKETEDKLIELLDSSL